MKIHGKRGPAGVLALVWAGLVALLWAGCMLGPDFQKPEDLSPDRYRFSEAQPEGAVDLRWWSLFDDPALETLVTVALRDNKDVRIAASRIEEARASLGFTRADLFPRLDLEAGAARGNFGGGRLSGSTGNNFFIAPTLSWEADFWGKFRRANEAARAELMASAYGLRTVQIGLIADVASAYFRLLDFHQRLEISRSTLVSREESLDIIQKRFDAGVIPEIDLNQAQIQKEIAAAAIPANQRLIARAEHTLSLLLARFPGEIVGGPALHEQTVPPDIPVGLPASLLERRPDVLQAMHLYEAQNARIGVAVAQRLPAISLTGALGGASTELSNVTVEGLAWSIGANLVGPLYNFGKNKQRVEIERARTEQALRAYERAALTAFREVADALNAIQTYREQVRAVERRLLAAQNAEALAKLRYDKGVTSYLEVLETERLLFDVALELSQVRQQYLNAYVALYKALGGGWLSEEEREAEQPPAPSEP